MTRGRSAAAFAISFALWMSQLVLAPPAVAQPCFADEAVPDWIAGDLALEEPGASRPLPVAAAGDYELCSDSAGFGADDDHYRYLVRRAAGDFGFEEVLLSIDRAGMGGVAARWDGRTANGALIRIAVHAVDGGFELRSGLRLDNGGVAIDVGQSMPVTLPVWLRIERAGSIFATSFSLDGVTFQGHFGIDATGRDLDRGVLVVGMVQASESSGAQSAVFGEPGFLGPEDPRPDVQSCVDDFAIPTTGGSELTLRGTNLESVTGVSLAGVPAEIVSRTRDALVVQAGESGPHRSGDVVVESAHGALSLGARVVYAGQPFVRADIDGDQKVQVGDLVRLGAALLNLADVACLEAADVNADRRVDRADWLRLLRVLFFRGAAPAAPFPQPGFAPDGGRACGLPDGPVIESARRLRDAGEAALARLPERPRVREGDVLVIAGSGFPTDLSRLDVRFGNVRTEVIEADPAGIRVRVLEVPDAGRKCPVVFQDTAQATPPLGVAAPASRFGIAHAVIDPGRRRAIVCPEFLASPLRQVNLGRLRSDGVSLLLPIDRASWDPTQPIRVSVSLPLPLVNGVSRGAREVAFTWLDGGRSGPTSYDEWVARLAARIDRELNGGSRSGDCECDATAYPSGDGIVITPCDPVITWDDNGTCCDPPHPGPGVQLKAPPPPISVADTYQVTPSSCEGEEGGPEPSQRNRVWCEFEKVVRNNVATGLPIWESYVPLDNLLEGPPGILNVEHPNDRTVSEKSVLFTSTAFYEAVEHGYNIPCRAAARAYYCNGGNSDWMPAFSAPQRVVKTFWLPDEKLPPSLEPDALYNYVDPNGVRQNLVGMHLAISTGGIFDYWTWSTFFAPRLVGEQHAVDGTSLAWNDACTVGAIADRPVEIQGVWQSYFMCTDGAPGESSCGNPWGPPNECLQQSCAGCHVAVGKVSLPDKPSIPELAMAWLPTLSDSEISQCFDEIKAANEEDGVELYKSMAPDDCQ